MFISWYDIIGSYTCIFLLGILAGILAVGRKRN